jgi:hypothetical protein
MQLEKDEIIKSPWLTGGLIVAILTALSYAMAFFYELGHSSYFGIPSRFIEVTLVETVIALCLVQYFAVIVVSGSSVITMYFPKKYDKILSDVLPVTIFIGLVYLINVDLRHLIAAGLIGGYIGKTATRERLREKGTDTVVNQILHRIFGKVGTTLLKKSQMWLLVFFISAFTVGKATAVWKEKYLVCDDSPQIALIRKYGDILIYAPYDQQKKEVAEKLIINSVTVANKLEFTIKSIGPLKKAPKHDETNNAK